jgi:hypothetical protein
LWPPPFLAHSFGVTVFLLSPASSSGERARILLRPEARFDLAVRLRKEGAALGEVYAFLSGLYFRGKLLYACTFGEPLVITPTRGLVHAADIVTRDDLLEFAEVDIQKAGARFTAPLERDARNVRKRTGEVVLLGSVASKKYIEVLKGIFGEGLLFPIDFVGRGDMSRGGLLLRAARAKEPLPYAPVASTKLNGKRPPRLEPVKGILKEALLNSKQAALARRRSEEGSS